MRADPGKDVFGAVEERFEGIVPAIDPAPAGHEQATITADDAYLAAGYCLWEFDGAAWILKKDRCKPGAVPSAPPATPGRFRGQLRAVMAVPAQAAVAASSTAGRAAER
jgi:hypothetical protein